MSHPSIPGLEPTLPIRNIYCIGRNYIDHAKELNNPVPKEPMIFLKPLSSICYNSDSIVLPSQSSDVHHEVELVVAIGKSGKHIPEQDALGYISGYGVGIDVTARDIQQKAKEKGHPWSVAKGFDTFSPISAFTRAEHISSTDFDLSLTVNGETRQSGNTRDMIFSISTLISHISSIFTLSPGDLIFTGTPSGVSAIKEGDHIIAKASHIDSLSVSVISE